MGRVYLRSVERELADISDMLQNYDPMGYSARHFHDFSGYLEDALVQCNREMNFTVNRISRITDAKGVLRNILIMRLKSTFCDMTEQIERTELCDVVEQRFEEIFGFPLELAQQRVIFGPTHNGRPDQRGPEHSAWLVHDESHEETLPPGAGTGSTRSRACRHDRPDGPFLSTQRAHESTPSPSGSTHTRSLINSRGSTKHLTSSPCPCTRSGVPADGTSRPAWRHQRSTRLHCQSMDVHEYLC